MNKLPQSVMYALRHGVSGKIWVQNEGGRWLWPSVDSLRKSWDAMQQAGLVGTDFREHKVVTIKLMEASRPCVR